MATQARLTTVEEVRNYLAGRHAKFTLVSKQTGNRYTFRFVPAKYDKSRYLEILRGPNNATDYLRIGRLYQNAGFAPGAHPRPGWWFDPSHKQEPGSRGLQWFLTMLRESPTDGWLNQMEFWHSGHCSKCGLELTNPESIARGLGPKCAAALSS